MRCRKTPIHKEVKKIQDDGKPEGYNNLLLLKHSGWHIPEQISEGTLLIYEWSATEDPDTGSPEKGVINPSPCYFQE